MKKFGIEQKSLNSYIINNMKQNRFKTLEYPNGPVLPPEYEPKGYSVNNTKLTALSEEMLFSAARYFEHDEYWPKLINTGNFWNCLKRELPANLKNLSFPADFNSVLKQMKSDQEVIKETKKSLTKEQKLAIKAEKDVLKAKHGFVILDGKNADIGGFMIEAPSLIITRGKDPRFGNWKYRVEEKDITINSQVTPKGWKGKTVFDPSAIWVISYQIKCGVEKTSSFKKLNKKVCFAGTTDVWQQTRDAKFDKSKDILKNWKKIQGAINAGINKGDDEAIIIYLIQQTGIRIGNERDEKLQALTYGMQTLENRHIDLTNNGQITFDFLGKDSVRDYRTINIDPIVFNELKKRWNQNKPNNKIFKTCDVNGYLKKIHPGATVKNLRTVVCNEILVNNLKQKKVSKDSTEAEKLRAIFEANLEIAKTLNHQKNVGKNQKEGEEKIAERVKKAKARVKTLKVKHEEKIAKLNDKLNKYRIAYKGMKILKEKENEIAEAKIKLTTQMERAKTAIEKTEFALDKKKLTKDISLGTSLAAYADPKLLYSYLKSIELPIEKIYTQSLRKAFVWAENIDSEYWRTYPS